MAVYISHGRLSPASDPMPRLLRFSQAPMAPTSALTTSNTAETLFFPSNLISLPPLLRALSRPCLMATALCASHWRAFIRLSSSPSSGAGIKLSPPGSLFIGALPSGRTRYARLYLLARRKGHAVHVAPQNASGPLDHGVAEVDDRAPGDRLHVDPAALVARIRTRSEQLQAAGDVEEDGQRPDARVAEQAGAPVVHWLRRVAQHAERGARRGAYRLRRGERAWSKTQLGVEVGADQLDDGVRLLHVGFDLSTASLDARWIRQRLGDARHIVLADIIEFNAVRPAVFDFKIANVFVPELVSPEQEAGSSQDYGTTGAKQPELSRRKGTASKPTHPNSECGGR